MQVNTALCFVIVGLGLLSLARRRLGLMMVWAALVEFIALATLAEYATGSDFGIDRLLVEPWTTTLTTHPGRMSPVTALCFTVVAAALLLGRKLKWRAVAAATCGVVLCVIAGMILFGYAVGIEAALGWGQFTRVAAHTAGGFLWLGAALLLVSRRAAVEINGRNPLRYLPLPAALAMILLLGLVAWRAQRDLGRHLLGETIRSLPRLDEEDRRLLSLRDEAVRRGSRDTSVLLVTGSLLAFVLVSLAGWHAHRESRRRSLSELEREQVTKWQEAILENAAYAIISTNPEGVITTFNRAAERMLGYTAAEMEGKQTPWIIHEPTEVAARAAKFSTELGRTIEPGFEVFVAKTRQNLPNEYEWTYVRKDGSRFPVLLSVTALRSGDGAITGFLGVARDITEHKRAEADRQKFVSLADNSRDFIGMCDRAFVPFYVNTAGREMMGLPSLEAACRVKVQDYFFPEDQRFITEEFFPRALRDGHGEIEIRFRHFQTGQAIWMIYRILNLCDATGEIIGWATISSDITDRKRAEKAIKESLAEKEILLREIHHRVKNNMQVISSLLNLQAGYIEDAHTRSLFADCQARVQSMAMIHEKLYRSPNLATVDFGGHVRDLAETLVRSFGETAGRVRLVVEAESVPLDIDTAIPVGLILNELVTNALKYAFPARHSGTIRVQFRVEPPASLLLSVADDGIGLPDGTDISHARTLGLKMIQSLTRQVNGHLEMGPGRGVEFRILFKRRAPCSRTMPVLHESAHGKA
jgi:PAS domain S-box-containing protein